MSEPHYYKVRIVGTGRGDDDVRPDWPASFAGSFCMAHRAGDDHCIAMTTEDVSVSGDRGAVVPIPDLPSATMARGVAFERVRDEMALGGVGHPERGRG